MPAHAHQSKPRAQRRLRILVYANVDQSEAGGVQAVVRRLRDAWAACGHAVETGWATASDGTAEATQDGWVAAFPVLAGKRWLHLRTLARITLKLLRMRPQIVNIHFASASTRYFNLLAPILGFRVLLTCHGSDVLRPLRQDEPHLGPVLRRADAISTVSHDIAVRIRARLEDSDRPPVTVIENGIDTDFWAPAAASAARCGSGQGRRRPALLLAVGRLAPVKGFDVLVDALALAVGRGLDARLVVIGEGPELAALQAKARDLGIAERLEFAGHCPPPAVRERLHTSDLFVMPSRSEGLPLALLEAMASGTPVLASAVGGVPSAVAGGGMLVPPGEPVALAEALVTLLTDPAARDRLARAGRERAQSFAIACTHSAYADLVQDLAAGRGAVVRTDRSAAGHAEPQRR